jgi:hypothetical protein
MSLHSYSGPRGLRGFTRFIDSYGSEVSLQESSAVATVDEAGAIVEIVTTGSPEYVWLRIDNDDSHETSGSAHLSRDNAEELRDALDAFLQTGGRPDPYRRSSDV